ncbi:hypothetical protein Pint_06618 [Pistacia integerrima]|uniref:Uncharacterized protein n=1 Tax=Pistacia integerrima TaxID=434235 RepID=A0ACC0Z161_9ROSI|nr:hypothetical protein Pint_06618 [Pistacia integerrima]
MSVIMYSQALTSITLPSTLSSRSNYLVVPCMAISVNLVSHQIALLTSPFFDLNIEQQEQLAGDHGDSPNVGNNQQRGFDLNHPIEQHEPMVGGESSNPSRD